MLVKFFEGKFMLKKIASACFSVFVFFGLLFAAQSDGFAQTRTIAYYDYMEIVQDYQSRGFGTPTSEADYQQISQAEGDLYRKFNENLGKKHSKEQESLVSAKEWCKKERSMKIRNQCIEAINLRIQEDSGAYLEASKKMLKIFGERKRKLNEARKTFNPNETRKHRQQKQQIIRKKYERRTY